jgi:AmmeMemoRadiSam system protein B
MGGEVRPAAVAGRFYPAEPDALRRLVLGYLSQPDLDDAPDGSAAAPKAIIAPHAGYRYSGAVAATAHAALRASRGRVRRVILAGPAHHVAVRGVALPSASAFATPLGPVAIDDEARRWAQELAGVVVDDGAHRPEHSLEVQLPFLLAVLGAVDVLPLLVAWSGVDVFAELLDALWGGDDTAIVVSTDLSHYHPADVARSLDRETAGRICRLDAPTPDGACGAAAVAGLLVAARRHDLVVRVLDLRNSADVSADDRRTVGYGAFALAAR